MPKLDYDEPSWVDILKSCLGQVLPAFLSRLEEKYQFDPKRYGDGKGGPFDFSRQATLLHISLQAAVPLRAMELDGLRRVNKSLFENTISKWSKDAGDYLSQHGDALMFRVKGKSAEAFNHLAKGIACMGFCPGGVTAFGTHWEF